MSTPSATNCSVSYNDTLCTYHRPFRFDISVTTYQVTEHTCAAALACVMYRGVDAVDIHHLTRDVRLKYGNVNHQMWSELMFDVDAPVCVTVGKPIVPVVGLVVNAKNKNSIVL